MNGDILQNSYPNPNNIHMLNISQQQQIPLTLTMGNVITNTSTVKPNHKKKQRLPYNQYQTFPIAQEPETQDLASSIYEINGSQQQPNFIDHHRSNFYKSNGSQVFSTQTVIDKIDAQNPKTEIVNKSITSQIIHQAKPATNFDFSQYEKRIENGIEIYTKKLHVQPSEPSTTSKLSSNIYTNSSSHYVDTTNKIVQNSNSTPVLSVQYRASQTNHQIHKPLPNSPTALNSNLQSKINDNHNSVMYHHNLEMPKSQQRAVRTYSPSDVTYYPAIINATSDQMLNAIKPAHNNYHQISNSRQVNIQHQYKPTIVSIDSNYATNTSLSPQRAQSAEHATHNISYRLNEVARESPNKQNYQTNQITSNAVIKNYIAAPARKSFEDQNGVYHSVTEQQKNLNLQSSSRPQTRFTSQQNNTSRLFQPRQVKPTTISTASKVDTVKVEPIVTKVEPTVTEPHIVKKVQPTTVKLEFPSKKAKQVSEYQSTNVHTANYPVGQNTYNYYRYYDQEFFKKSQSEPQLPHVLSETSQSVESKGSAARVENSKLKIAIRDEPVRKSKKFRTNSPFKLLKTDQNYRFNKFKSEYEFHYPPKQINDEYGVYQSLESYKLGNRRNFFKNDSKSHSSRSTKMNIKKKENVQTVSKITQPDLYLIPDKLAFLRNKLIKICNQHDKIHLYTQPQELNVLRLDEYRMVFYFPVSQHTLANLQKSNVYVVRLNESFQGVNPNEYHIKNIEELADVHKIIEANLFNKSSPHIIIKRGSEMLKLISQSLTSAQYKISRYQNINQLVNIYKRSQLNETIVLIADQVPDIVQIFHNHNKFMCLIIPKGKTYKAQRFMYTTEEYKWIFDSQPNKVIPQVKHLIENMKPIRSQQSLGKAQREKYNLLVLEKLKIQLGLQVGCDFFNHDNLKHKIKFERTNIFITDESTYDLVVKASNVGDKIIVFGKKKIRSKNDKIVLVTNSHSEITDYLKGLACRR